MKIITDATGNNKLSLIEQSDLISKQEQNSDVTYKLIDLMHIFYPDNYGEYKDGKNNSVFNFDNTLPSRYNLLKLATFINTIIDADDSVLGSMLCMYDDRLTDLLNQYIQYGTNSKLTIESFSEDMEELLKLTHDHPEFNYIFESLYRSLSYTFYNKPDFNVFDVKYDNHNGVNELNIQRSTAVVYFTRLSSRLMFKNKLHDNFHIADTESDLYKMLNETWEQCEIFRKTNRAILIVNNPFTKIKQFELYKNVDGIFVIASKTDY